MLIIIKIHLKSRLDIYSTFIIIVFFLILVEDKKRTSEENLGNLANPKARKPGFGSDHRDLSHLAESAGARRFQNKKLVAKKRLNLIRNGFVNQ